MHPPLHPGFAFVAYSREEDGRRAIAEASGRGHIRKVSNAAMSILGRCPADPSGAAHSVSSHSTPTAPDHLLMQSHHYVHARTTPVPCRTGICHAHATCTLYIRASLHTPMHACTPMLPYVLASDQQHGLSGAQGRDSIEQHHALRRIGRK